MKKVASKMKQNSAAQYLSTRPHHGLVATSTACLPTVFQRLIDNARENQNRGVLRAEATARKAGYGLSTLWRDVKEGVFVPPIHISERSVAWVEVEVDAILAAKALMTRSNIRIDLKLFVAMLSAPSTTLRDTK